MLLALCIDNQSTSLTGRLAGFVFAAVASSAEEAAGSDESPSPALDLEDIRRSRGGDGEAYRSLIERYQGHVSSMMWRFSRDPQTHEELVQDVFVEAYMSLSNYRARAPFSHWLSRLATRVGYRFWKRQARERTRPTVSFEEWDQAAGEAAGEIDPSEAAEMLHGLLEELPPRDRLVLTLRYLEDLSVEETAERTGWSQSMVKVQAWRAREKLKKLFAKAEGEAT